MNPTLLVRDLLADAAVEADLPPTYRDRLLERVAPDLTAGERYRLWEQLTEAAQMAETLGDLDDATIPADYENRDEVDDSLLTYQRDRDHFLQLLVPGPVAA